MRVDVITLFPEVLSTFGQSGIVGRACQRGLLQLRTWNPRDYALDRHRTVDDRPYGGGPGMVMKVQPLRDALQAINQVSGGGGSTLYLSPQGQLLDQNAVRMLVTRPHLILVAGRYEGIDERFIASWVDEEWSIGDYVLSGGELAAMVLIDAVTRLLPGALGDAESAKQDSFMEGLLEFPQYTRPEEVDGMPVPAVLMSGDHAAIWRWRLQESLGRTWLRRPDLLEKIEFSREQQILLEEFVQHYKQQHGHVKANPAVSSDEENT